MLYIIDNAMLFILSDIGQYVNNRLQFLVDSLFLKTFEKRE